MLKTEVYQIPENSDTTFSLKGNNKKNLLVICHESDMNTETMVTLDQILKAIQHNVSEDVLTVMVQKQSILDLSEILNAHKAKNILSFGLGPAKLGFNIQVELYRLHKFEYFTMIFSHSIPELNMDKEKKIRLWKSMQQLFPKDV